MSLPTLYLLPGLGADRRIYTPQMKLPIDLRIVDWPIPHPHEELHEYVDRIAPLIDPDRPFCIGGFSFGGIVAIELARRLRPRAILLISSCRSSDCIPTWYRPVAWMAALLPPEFLTWTAMNSPLTDFFFEPLDKPAEKILHDLLDDADPRIVAWSLETITMWRGEAPPGIPLFQVHGARDRSLPARLARPDLLIPDAGHLLHITHAERVNAFILEMLHRVADAPEETISGGPITAPTNAARR